MRGIEFVVFWDTRLKVPLKDCEVAHGSTFRYLTEMREGFLGQKDHLRGHLMRWGCNNWVVTKIVILGSMMQD